MKTQYSWPATTVTYMAHMITPIDTPYHKDRNYTIKRMATCTICKNKCKCIVTENNENIIYYCDTCYAHELARSVPPMKFRRPKRKFYVKQSIR